MTTSPLGEKIKAIIRANGPMSVTDFFALCLADPEHGYYQSREPFGRDGDFITAPEISQLFGEMIGIFLVHAWQRHGMPANPRLVEVGPGRGTMMADILRVMAKLAPALYQSVGVHLVETSPRLQWVQKDTLADHAGQIEWHTSFDTIPAGFTLLAANELFDAIPIRQFVRTSAGFRERMVILDERDELAFGLGVATLDPSFIPADPRAIPDGTVFEFAPARQAVMTTLCERLKNSGGTAIIIDYGSMVTGFGDTLQAVLNHDYDPPLDHPGLADLTSHVDFQHLGEVARANGVSINGCCTQGDFLYGLGLQQRVKALSEGKDRALAMEIQTAASRLADEGEGKMGELFKVLVVSSPQVDLLPFRPAAH